MSRVIPACLSERRSRFIQGSQDSAGVDGGKKPKKLRKHKEDSATVWRGRRGGREVRKIARLKLKGVLTSWRSESRSAKAAEVFVELGRAEYHRRLRLILRAPHRDRKEVDTKYLSLSARPCHDLKIQKEWMNGGEKLNKLQKVEKDSAIVRRRRKRGDAETFKSSKRILRLCDEGRTYKAPGARAGLRDCLAEGAQGTL
ncbi:hypothetical protein GP486_003952 [Trichoglossum hirsutum]|uniref:Uncharacterized protein n=1 Tax=Trichoglossum hirsutum TaxID=265104 RepID=A0A9P8LC35_9PEZI|nr:hypothetical protein GP486_003952 [Trichoglossum hirsutum]